MALASSSVCRLAASLSAGVFIGVPLRVAKRQFKLPPRGTTGAWALNDVVTEVVAESTPANPSR
jgi:hypothetical protein